MRAPRRCPRLVRVLRNPRGPKVKTICVPNCQWCAVAYSSAACQEGSSSSGGRPVPLTKKADTKTSAKHAGHPIRRAI